MDAGFRPDTSGRTRWFTPRLAALLCVMAVLAGFRAVGDASAEPALQATPEEARAAFIAAVDRARAAAGLPAYTVHPQLDELAQAHADYLISTGRFSHIGPRGRSARSRILAAGFPGHRAGENYVSRKNAELAVRWLLDDPPHRNNVLHTFYNAHGVGVGRTQWGDWLFVQDLGNDPNAAAVAAAASAAADAIVISDVEPVPAEIGVVAAAAPLIESQPVDVEVEAPLIESPPVDVEVEAPLVESAPVDVEAEAALIESQPVDTEAAALLIESAPVDVAAAAPLIEPEPVDVAAAPVIEPEPAVVAALSPPYGFRVARDDGRGMDVPAFETFAEDVTATTDSANAPVLISGSAVWPLGPAPFTGWLIPLLSAVIVILVITRFSGRP